MNTIIFIDGGIGRVLCSIPALLKYHRLNPNKEWYVIVAAWDYLFWGIPDLQNRSFHSDTKGIFENDLEGFLNKKFESKEEVMDFLEKVLINVLSVS
jgi:hypothetical protein